METPSLDDLPITGQLRLNGTDLANALAENEQARWTNRIAGVAGATFVTKGLLVTFGSDLSLAGGGPLIAVGLVCLYSAYLLPRVRVKSMLSGKSADELNTRYSLDESSCTIETHISSARTQWSAVRHYHEGTTTFLLFVSPSVPVLLPKRAFVPADVVRIGALLRAHLAHTEATARKTRRVLILSFVLGVLPGLAYLVFA